VIFAPLKMTRETYKLRLAALLSACALVVPMAIGRQVTLPAPKIIVRPGQQQPPRQDPFDNLIASAASFDMDSPVTARAEFDPPVAVAGQRIVFRVEVSALDESLKVPENLSAPGLQFHAGGHGQTYQHTSATKLQPRTTYLYHVTAGAAGTFTVPGFDVLAYGKPIKVPATTLIVNATNGAAIREPLELLMQIPDGDIYVGQLLRVQLLLPDAADGRLPGFSRPHIASDYIFSEPFSFGMRREIVQFEGKSFPAFTEEMMVTPLREGPQEIIAEAFLQTGTLIDSEPMTLNVKALPAKGRLPGFTGAVGNFQVDLPRLSTLNPRAGEPLTLTVTLRGDGNLGRMVPPPAPSPRDWQVFPPTTESIPPIFVQQRRFVNFAYTMIPLNDQSKTTPPIPFSYFDPVKKTYVDLTIPPVPVTVAPGAGGTNVFSAENAEPTDAEPEPVFRGLANEPGRVVASLTPLQQRGWFLALQLLPAAVLGGLWFRDSRRRYHEQHPEVLLKRRARRGLRRQIRLARHAAAAGDAAGFAARASNALREACAPHSAANPDALVCADVLRELPEPQPDTRNREIVSRVFAAADSLRFGGPDRNGQELLALQPELEGLLAQMKERL